MNRIHHLGQYFLIWKTSNESTSKEKESITAMILCHIKKALFLLVTSSSRNCSFPSYISSLSTQTLVFLSFEMKEFIVGIFNISRFFFVNYPVLFL